MDWRNTKTAEVTEATTKAGRKWVRVEARSLEAFRAVMDELRAAHAVVCGTPSRVMFGSKRTKISERCVYRSPFSGGSDAYVETVVGGYWLAEVSR